MGETRRGQRARSRIRRGLGGALALVTLWAAGLRLSPGRAQDAAQLAGTSLPLAQLEQAIAHRPSRHFFPVGNTSVVFRMELEGALDAAFKPQTRTHPRGDLAEVAAYRIGRFLGMTHVVPAVPRRVALATLEQQLASSYASEWEGFVQEMIVRDGSHVRGAAIYWIPDMHDLRLDTEEGIARWSRWLSLARPAPTQRARTLASQVSSMLALDYLVGNWDRFSGANAQGDAPGKNLLVRDHNVAFYTPLPHVQQRRLVARLTRVQRFSRTLVTQLARMDEAALSLLIHREGDPPGYAPLTLAQQRDVLTRRRTLMSYIAALIALHGQDRVLGFP